ncbi:MAG: hypothetical protein U9Q58_00585 [Pseudomonadota bacterium]|nr:hypothetical protein [Pseudomonadota bacterium]
MKKIFLLLLVSCFLLVACSSTKVTGIWQDENYKGKSFANILVVSSFLDGEAGRMSEVQLARYLRKKGVSASPGHVVLPSGSRASVEAISAAIGKHAFDGVLISRLVDKIDETQIVAKGSCNSRWDSDYRQNDRYSLSPCPPGSRTRTTAVYGVETKLYSAENRELVMSFSSKTTTDRPSGELIKGFVKTVVEHLSRADLLSGSGLK